MNKKDKKILTDINKFLWQIDKPNRIQALYDMHKGLSDAVFWELFHTLYMGSENPSQDLHLLDEMLDRSTQLDRLKSPERLNLLPTASRKFYETLPNELTIYRGCRSFNEHGLSWTTDHQVAKRFACRMTGRDSVAIVLWGRALKNDIIACYQERSILSNIDIANSSLSLAESEVVIQPKHVQVTGRESFEVETTREGILYEEVQTGEWYRKKPKEKRVMEQEATLVFQYAHEGDEWLKERVKGMEKVFDIARSYNVNPLLFGANYDQYIVAKQILAGEQSEWFSKQLKLLRQLEADQAKEREITH